MGSGGALGSGFIAQDVSSGLGLGAAVNPIVVFVWIYLEVSPVSGSQAYDLDCLGLKRPSSQGVMRAIVSISYLIHAHGFLLGTVANWQRNSICPTFRRPW